MQHPDVGIQLAHDLIAQRHADAARARLIRQAATRKRVAEPQPPPAAAHLVIAPPPSTADAASSPGSAA